MTTIDIDTEFKNEVSGKFGDNFGALYEQWHAGYSQTLTKRWLREHKLPANALIRKDHKKNLSNYLNEKFKDWVIKMLED